MVTPSVAEPLLLGVAAGWREAPKGIAVDYQLLAGDHGRVVGEFPGSVIPMENLGILTLGCCISLQLLGCGEEGLWVTE